MVSKPTLRAARHKDICASTAGTMTVGEVVNYKGICNVPRAVRPRGSEQCLLNIVSKVVTIQEPPTKDAEAGTETLRGSINGTAGMSCV